MSWTDDPARDYDRWCDEQDKKLERRPRCCLCEEHIQDDSAVYIDGDWYCDRCLDEHRQMIDED